MSDKTSIPRLAAAMILLRDPEDPKIFWVKRSLSLAFMGGYQAFPGGQKDKADSEPLVLNCEDPEAAAMRVCAVRELFEEAGILLARGVEHMSQERLRELRKELDEGKVTFPTLLEREGLVIDGSDLDEAPRWVTPAPAPRRFDTWFFVAWIPECSDGPQEVDVIPGELESGEWHRPSEAVAKWRNGEILIAPPVLFPILEVERGVKGFVSRLYQRPQAHSEKVPGVEFRYGFDLVALRTPTIPPATHTNCYLIGREKTVIIDPGSPYPDEQARLDVAIDNLLAEGRRVTEILITHLHPDHIGGVSHLAEKYGIPVACHQVTAEALFGQIKVSRFIEDGEVIDLGGDPGWKLHCIWSPGHARGHLSFWEERTGSLITGDCVVGQGTVVIAPPEGNMKDYLGSLRQYLALPRITALFPGHGPVLANSRSKIEEYIQHRLDRESSILAVLGSGPHSIPAIVEKVYTDVSPSLHQLASLTVQAHLDKLISDQRVSRQGDAYGLA